MRPLKLVSIFTGELKCEVENVAQDSNKKSNDVVSNNVSNYFQESEGETSKDSCVDNFPISDWGMENSPYERRILNWITELQYGGDHDQKEAEEQDCNSMGTFNFNPQEFADTWDYSGFLWDL